MNDAIRTIDSAALRAVFHDGEEIALLDAREEVPFDARHLLMAACVPLGRIEMLVDDLVPRRDTRVVWCDGGDDQEPGLAMRAAARTAGLGYGDVRVLDGGVAAWEAAGLPVYSGVHVPSKAFAEVVEHAAGTPWISAETLKQLIDERADMVILDSRSYEEYHGNSIPGAVSVPGAELVYRFRDLVPSPKTRVVVNCGGRTRSIIGAQALIDAGVPNQVVSLKNGTQDWHLAGYEVVVGADRRPPEVSETGQAFARDAAGKVATRFGIERLDSSALDAWKDAGGPGRTTYVLDVRTPDEYEQGHLPGVRSAPGGQLIQETDVFLGIWGSRVALVDSDGVRAVMTASWLLQMGWPEVVVHQFDPQRAGSGTDPGALEMGPWRARVLGAPQAGDIRTITPAELEQMLGADRASVVDLAYSGQYRRSHIPGAAFALRSHLDAAVAALPDKDALVFTCPDGELAALAAAQLGVSQSRRTVYALAGGTNAWVEAGLALESGRTHMASPADDVRLKAREMEGGVEEAMRAYLAWEIDLVNQMAADPDQRFKIAAP